ncbi:MAG: hypothetical protein ABI572_02575 [Actinomycetota bacterium]
MTSDRRHATLILAAVAIVAGLAGAAAGIGEPLLADQGTNVGKLFAMNTAGGLLTIGVGTLALASGLLRKPVLEALAGLGFLAAAGLTLLGVGRSFNYLGGRGNTLCLFLMLGIGLVALALSPQVRADEA